jgi:TPP-dependent indolepyruvate ferredoxin oxidoreductase alpha subunit
VSRADAAAQALVDAGVRVCAFVPGYGGTEVFDALSQRAGAPPLTISFHEEVAYGLCHGASLGGVRAACLIKSHGLAKAANAVLSSLSAGARGGLVALVFDDEQGAHSDNIIRASGLTHGMELPWQHVGEGANLYDHVRRAFEASERRGLPYALVIPTAGISAPDVGQRQGRWAPPPAPLGFARDPARHVVCPPLSSYQRRVLDAKRASQDPDAVPRPALLTVPNGLPPKLRPLATRYAVFFDAFREVRGPVVAADAGTSALFAFPPYGGVDLCTYMGGSVPLALGAHCAGHRPVWALSGDFSFIAAGHLGLLEALQRGIPLKVVIFSDGAATATGGQPIPRPLLDAVLAAYLPFVREVADPCDPGAIQLALDEAQRCDTLRILVLNYRAERHP